MSDANPGDAATAICPVCHASFVPSRPGHTVCSATCRKRKQRGTYVISPEDRAAIEKVRALPLPIPRLHPDDVKRYVAATAIVNGDEP